MSKLVNLLAVTAVSSISCSSCFGLHDQDNFFSIGVDGFRDDSKISIHEEKITGKDKGYGLSLGHTYYGSDFFTDISARGLIGKDKSDLEPGENVEKLKKLEASIKLGLSFNLCDRVTLHPYTGIHYSQSRYKQDSSRSSLGERSILKSGYLPVGLHIRFIDNDFSMSSSVEYARSIMAKHLTKEDKTGNTVKLNGLSYNSYKASISLGYKDIALSPYIKYEKGKVKNLLIGSGGNSYNLGRNSLKSREIGVKVSYLF